MRRKPTRSDLLLRVAAAAGSAAFLAAGPVGAATAIGAISVSATIQSSCTVAASPSPPGTPSPAQAAAPPVGVTCTNPTPSNIALSAGQASAATAADPQPNITIIGGPLAGQAPGQGTNTVIVTITF